MGISHTGKIGWQSLVSLCGQQGLKHFCSHRLNLQQLPAHLHIHTCKGLHYFTDPGSSRFIQKVRDEKAEWITHSHSKWTEDCQQITECRMPILVFVDLTVQQKLGLLRAAQAIKSEAEHW